VETEVSSAETEVCHCWKKKKWYQ